MTGMNFVGHPENNLTTSQGNQEPIYDSPIFIGGLDRTGKTPLRLILTSHSNIAISRRTYMWSKYYQRYGDLHLKENFENCLQQMLNSKNIQFLEPDEASIRKKFWEGEPTYGRLFAIIQMDFARRWGRGRWGEQMGMLESYADPIFASYPNAKIIHMVRDPRLRYGEKFANNSPKPGKLGWETGRWLNSIELANRNLERYPSNYKILRYESLFVDPQLMIKEICDFIHEPFEPGMLNMEDAIRFGSKPVEINSYLVDYGEDGFPGGKAIQKKISAREVAFIQSNAGKELLEHDYPLENREFSIADWIIYSVFDWPINSIGELAWKISTFNSSRLEASTKIM